VDDVLDMTELADSPEKQQHHHQKRQTARSAQPRAAQAWQSLFREQQDRLLAKRLQRVRRPGGRIVSALQPAPSAKIKTAVAVAEPQGVASGKALTPTNEREDAALREQQVLASQLGVPLPTLQAVIAKKQ
jgi:hypothetical protein